ncbi:MAG: hypothetical protein JKX73_00475 [Flavobacteriales bacterium]|nr:hypothetical protein [Flavobacteriales bacterium]
MEREIVISRLAIVKQLFNQGVEQSYRSEGISSFSVLSFHDCVEMFLRLYSEYKNEEESFSFPKYWERFPELPQKEQMVKLALRRKNLKHKGVFPSKLDIEHSRFSTKEFLEKATLLLDHMEFAKVSLTDLIALPNVREMLKSAEISILSKENDKVLEKTATAFEVLINGYEEKAKGDYNSPFYFGQSLSFYDSFFMGLSNFEQSEETRKMGEFVDRVGESIEQIQKAIKIISLGIDYRKYVKFKYLTPVTTFMRNGEVMCEIDKSRLKEQYENEELEFLVIFVIESALKLQEFEIDYDSLNFVKPELGKIKNN